MGKFIEVKNLTYFYNQGTINEVQALKNVNIYVDRGEIVGIVGPSGSGKSTLLQHFNGLLLQQNGDVLINGVSISDYSNIKDVRRKVGLLFQNPEDQIFEKYVGDEIAYALFNFGYSKEDARERVRELLNKVGYGFEFKNRLTKELSGGEKRIVSFLSVIAYKPELLVLDEPTVGLDNFYRQKILNLINEWAYNGNSVIMVSHNMDEVFKTCHRVYLLNNGSVVAHGKTEEVLMKTTLLLDSGLTPPDFIMLISSLKQRGIRIKDDIYSEEDLVNYVVDQISRVKGISL